MMGAKALEVISFQKQSLLSAVFANLQHGTLAWLLLKGCQSQNWRELFYNPPLGCRRRANLRPFMENTSEQRKRYEEPFKHAAVHFYQTSGKGLEEAAAELGLRPAELRNWRRKYAPTLHAKSAKPSTPVAQLQAENQALRDEILHLKVQWDVLKATLGILSTSVCPRQNAE
jgi:transposase-like protein